MRSARSSFIEEPLRRCDKIKFELGKRMNQNKWNSTLIPDD